MNTFVLNITNRCNFTCGHCLREGCSMEDLDLELLQGCLPTLKTFGVERIALTGGEPILHPEFSAMVELLANDGFKLGFVSNGWFYKRYLRVLGPYREHVAYLALSLDGHTPDEHDRVREKPGSFERVIEAIDAFHAAGYRVNLSHILNRRTAQQLLAFGRFIADKPVWLNVGAVIPAEGNDPWQLEPGQRSALRLSMTLLSRKLGNRIAGTTSLGVNTNYMFCNNFESMNSVALRYDGDVVFCCDCPTSNRGAVMGNINHEPLGQILRRHPERLATILNARLAAMAQGNPGVCNDCRFCNQILAREYTETNQPGPPELVNF